MKPNFVTNQAVQYRVLDENQCAEIANATFRILERTGCVVHHEEARKLLQEAGCYVDGERVRIPAQLMRWAVDSAPSTITMYDRFGNPAMKLAPYEVNFGPTNSDTFVYDEVKGEKRRATMQDAVKFGLLCDALPNINWASTLVMISDRNDKLADVHELHTILPLTAKPIMNFSFGLDNLKDMIEMCEVVVGGAEKLAAHPMVMTMICPVCPLQHTQTGLDQIMYMAKKRLPVLYIPGMSLGLASPITFAGSIALGLADTLAGLLVSQLTQKGAPFIACNYTDNTDMRTVSISYAHPEYQLVLAASADVYRYLDIPFSTNMGATDQGVFDQEAVFEIATSLYTSILSGGNMAFSLGALECGKSSCVEALVFCDEAVGFLKRLVQGVEISEYTLAEDIIHQVGPGGNFLGEETTANEFKKFWKSSALVGMTYEQRKASDKPEMNQRLRARAEEIIAKGPQHPLSDDVMKKLDSILARAEKRVSHIK